MPELVIARSDERFKLWFLEVACFYWLVSQRVDKGGFVCAERDKAVHFVRFGKDTTGEQLLKWQTVRLRRTDLRVSLGAFLLSVRGAGEWGRGMHGGWSQFLEWKVRAEDTWMTR